MKMGEERGEVLRRTERKEKRPAQRRQRQGVHRREKRPEGAEQERDSQRTTTEDAVEDADLHQTRVRQRRKE